MFVFSFMNHKELLVYITYKKLTFSFNNLLRFLKYGAGEDKSVNILVCRYMRKCIFEEKIRKETCNK